MSHALTLRARHARSFLLSRDFTWSLAFLLSASVFASYFSAKKLLFNPDALIGPYMVQGGSVFHNLFIADWHTNLLKFPLLYLQSITPFNIGTFIAMNTVLILVSVLAWCAIIAWAFGKRYFAPLAIFFSLLLYGSIAISNEIAFVTTRNIEFPLCIFLIVLFWRKLAPRPSIHKEQYLLIALFISATTILFASDPFFTYVLLVPLILTYLTVSIREKWQPRQILLWLGVLILPLIFAKLFIKFMLLIGAFQYYGETLHPSVYKFSQLPTAFWNGLQDLITLYNADFFDKPISMYLGATYLLFGVLIVSIASLIAYLQKIPQLIKTTPELATILLTGPFAFLIYCLTFSFEHQYRYVVLLLFTMSTTLVLASFPYIKRFNVGKPSHIVLASVTGAFLAGSFYYGYHQEHNYHYATYKENLKTINAYIAKEGANTIITGHTYASNLKFWSNQDPHIAPIIYCNQNLPFLTRESWYKPTAETTNVALVVDKSGRDANSWFCSTDKIMEYYGKPLASTSMPGIDNKNVDIYIYPANALDKILLIKTKGTPQPLLSH